MRLLFLAAAEPEQRVLGRAELKHPCPKAVFNSCPEISPAAKAIKTVLWKHHYASHCPSAHLSKYPCGDQAVPNLLSVTCLIISAGVIYIGRKWCCICAWLWDKCGEGSLWELTFRYVWSRRSRAGQGQSFFGCCWPLLFPLCWQPSLLINLQQHLMADCRIVGKIYPGAARSNCATGSRVFCEGFQDFLIHRISQFSLCQIPGSELSW